MALMTTNTLIAKHEQDLPVKVKVLKHHRNHGVGEDEHLEGNSYLGRVRVWRSRSKKRKQLWVLFYYSPKWMLQFSSTYELCKYVNITFWRIHFNEGFLRCIATVGMIDIHRICTNFVPDWGKMQAVPASRCCSTPEMRVPAVAAALKMPLFLRFPFAVADGTELIVFFIKPYNFRVLVASKLQYD